MNRLPPPPLYPDRVSRAAMSTTTRPAPPRRRRRQVRPRQASALSLLLQQQQQELPPLSPPHYRVPRSTNNHSRRNHHHAPTSSLPSSSANPNPSSSIQQEGLLLRRSLRGCSFNELRSLASRLELHGLFGLVELARADDIVFGRDGREAILALGGEGLFGDGLGGGCVVDRGGVRFDGGIVVIEG